MQKNNHYTGWELESFDGASNFREYQFEKIKKFIKKKKILDVGSGNGGLVKYFNRVTNKISLFEPSEKLYRKLKKNFKRKKFKILKKKPNAKTKYDAILYMDVIEHIKNYYEELNLIKRNLKKNGFLIVNVPAFNLLFTNFDKSIGHIKRFTKKDFIFFSKKYDLAIRKMEYYDVIGFLLIFVSKYFFGSYLKSNNLNNNIRIWNALIPLSKILDKVFFSKFGKSLICVLQKK